MARTETHGARIFALWLAGAAAACGPLAELANEVAKQENQSVSKTCEKVSLCGGVHTDTEECEDALEDIVADGRVTQERAIACAACMAHNSCEEIQELRHCDVACEGIGYVENLHTSTCLRSRLCDDVVTSCQAEDAPAERRPYDDCKDPELTCGDDAGPCSSCIDALSSALKETPELDSEVELCADCVEQTRSDAADAGSEAPFCSRLIARCRESCTKVGVIAELLADAEARIAETAALTRLCTAALACGSSDGPPPDCVTRIETALATTDGGTELSPLIEPCTTCLESQSCDVPTRIADCSSSCGAFGF